MAKITLEHTYSSNIYELTLEDGTVYHIDHGHDIRNNDPGIDGIKRTIGDAGDSIVIEHGSFEWDLVEKIFREIEINA